MEPGTRAHLLTANENGVFATRLIDVDDQQSLPADLRWALVAAFYAAVHLVNAYLWEQRRIEPRNHDVRLLFVVMVSSLRPVASDYAHLQDLAYRARYHFGFRLPPGDARVALTCMESIDRLVSGELSSGGV